MSLVLDYVVFMTYDLHGQWDYGNAFSDPGCPLGNCLCSHVNLTETYTALSMITKSGVGAYKVLVGTAMYGRAFEMTTVNCTDENCAYTGPASGATPGQCTQTVGILADAEIFGVIQEGGVNSYRDNTSFSDILVYNETQWVAYMYEGNKAHRADNYKSWNLGGTSEWAIDLASPLSRSNIHDDVNEADEFDDEDADMPGPCDYSLTFNSLADLEAVSD
jgi:chitinase